MDGPFYTRDFGKVNGQTLVRIVFLDAVSLHGLGMPREEKLTKDAQIKLIRDAFFVKKPDARWKIIASHYPVRSETKIKHSRKRIMIDLLPLFEELNVDLVLSGNDRFQQIINIDNEPLHVSTNGGGKKIENIETINTENKLILSRRGYSLISIDNDKLTVELLDKNGKSVHKRTRIK